MSNAQRGAGLSLAGPSKLEELANYAKSRTSA